MTPSQPDFPAIPTLDRALELVRFLRANCEWDAAQTPRSLLPYLLEEAHETAESVAAGDDAALRGELGDLLLNVAFQIVLAEERDAFNADDVVRALETKMRRRHPHIYGEGDRVEWEELKRLEREQAGKGPHGLLHGVPAGLEPLSRAHRLQDRVASVGFDWPNASSALEKVREEVEEVAELIAYDAAAHRNGIEDRDAALEDELGDLLFAVVNVARLAGVHAMRALLRANDKFTQRFNLLESLARDRNVELANASLDELEELWQEVKRTGRGID